MVREKYIKDKIGPTADFFVRVLVRANASDISANAFRQLFTFLTFADPDGKNAFPCHETVAAITGCSVATSKRATNELKTAKWISTERTRRGPAIRTVKIPQEDTVAIEVASLEVPPVTLLNGSSKSLKYHPRDSRSITGDTLPTTTYLPAANHEGSYLKGGGEKKEKQLDAVTQPEAASYGLTRKGRKAVQSW
jgi:hypothetical protein